MRTRWLSLIVLPVTVGFLAACANSPGTPGTHAEHESRAGSLADGARTSTASVLNGRVATTTDWVSNLPIARYMLSPTQSQLEVDAADRLAVPCMRSFGFDWTAPAAGSSVSTATLDSRRYGVTSLDQATKYGYELPATADRATANQTSSAPMTAQEQLVFSGAPVDRSGQPMTQVSVAGKQVPTAGCYGQAVRELTGPNGAYGPTSEATNISGQSFSESLKSPTLAAAFTRWSACMAHQGFAGYANPLKSAADPRWRSPASPLEIETAVADVGCANQISLDSTWSKVEAGLQDALIKKNLAELQQESAAATLVKNRAATYMSTGKLSN